MTTLVQVCNMALGRLGTHQAISALNEPSSTAQIMAQFVDQARRSLLGEFDWPFAKVLIPLAQTGNVAPPPWDYEYARPMCIRVRSLAILTPPGQFNVNVIPSGSASYLDFGTGFLGIGGPAYSGALQPNIGANPSPTIIPFSTGAVQVTPAMLAALSLSGGGGGGGGGSSGGGGGGGNVLSLTAPTYSSAGGAVPVIWTNVNQAAAWVTVDIVDPNLWEPGFLNVFSWHLAAEVAVAITGSAQVQQAMMAAKENAMAKATAQEGNEDPLIASWNADWIDAREYGYQGWGHGAWNGWSGYGDGY